MIGSTEIIVVAVVGLVLFGATALPKFARSLGQAKKEFEKGIKQGVEEEAAAESDAEGEKPAAKKSRRKAES